MPTWELPSERFLEREEKSDSLWARLEEQKRVTPPSDVEVSETLELREHLPLPAVEIETHDTGNPVG